MQDDENERTGSQDSHGNDGANGNNGGNGGEGAPGGNGPEPTLISNANLEEAFDTARMLIEYASSSAVAGISQATKRLLASMQAWQEGLWSVEVESEFWLAYRDLTRALQPATAESIYLSGQFWV